MTLKNQQRIGLMAKQPWYHGVTLPWEQNIIDNAVNYSIVEWRSLGKTTKTIVKTYKEAKELYDLTNAEYSATLVYAISTFTRVRCHAIRLYTHNYVTVY